MVPAHKFSTCFKSSRRGQDTTANGDQWPVGHPWRASKGQRRSEDSPLWGAETCFWVGLAWIRVREKLQNPRQGQLA